MHSLSRTYIYKFWVYPTSALPLHPHFVFHLLFMAFENLPVNFILITCARGFIGQQGRYTCLIIHKVLQTLTYILQQESA